jgi:hypothetical protein
MAYQEQRAKNPLVRRRYRRPAAIDDEVLRPFAVLQRCSVAVDRTGMGWHQVTRRLAVDLQE